MTQPSDKLDYKWLASERFNSTKLHGYDQITTVSQNAINRQIELMHRDSPNDSPLLKFSTSTTEKDNYTQIKDAKLNPSTVELLLGTDENQTVLFTLNLESGTFNYWGGTRANPEKRSATIKDWRVVSRVRLNLLELETAKVPEFVRKSLTNPHDYSVRQLLVDFTTADISTYDDTLSVIEDDEAKEEFHKHIKMYFNRLKADNNGSHSTIHYLPFLKKPDTHLAPTIVPTSLNFQNYPFVWSKWTERGEKNNDNNMLIYLQMTEGRKFPPDLLPAPTANWVVPTNPRYDGTVCISKHTFLDNWLLPRLAQFNNVTTWFSVIKDEPSKTPVPYSLNGQFGPSGYENAKNTPWEFDAKGSNNTVLTYYYYRENVTTKKGYGDKLAQQRVNVWNHLHIPVGLDANDESVIKLNGRTEVWSWITNPAWAIDAFVWTADLVLRNESHDTDNGKLKIEVRNVTTSPTAQENGDASKSGVAQQIKDEIKSLQSDIGKKYDELINTMTHLRGDVDKLFGNSWEFIFGGNDDFFIDKAGFNSEGDLLAQLVYRLKT